MASKSLKAVASKVKSAASTVKAAASGSKSKITNVASTVKSASSGAKQKVTSAADVVKTASNTAKTVATPAKSVVSSASEAVKTTTESAKATVNAKTSGSGSSGKSATSKTATAVVVDTPATITATPVPASIVATPQSTPAVDSSASVLADSWAKETVTLEEAKVQTSQAQAYLIAKDTQTQENQAAHAQATQDTIARADTTKSAQMQSGLVGSNSTMYQDITGQYVPSIVSSEYASTYIANQEAAKVQAAKRAIADSQTMQLIGGFGDGIKLSETTETEKSRSEKLSDFLAGTSNKVKSSTVVQGASGAVSAVAGSEAVKKAVAVEDTILGAIGMPTITQAIDTGSNVVNSISEAASYGFSGGSSGSIKTSDKEYLTSGIARKGQEYAGKITEKGSALVSSGVDLLAGKDNVIQVPSLVGTGQTINIPSSTAKSFVTGATVDMASFVVGGVAGVPLLGEVAVRDPTQLAGALVGGVGLVAGGTAKMVLDEPTRFAGSLIGGAAIGKVAGTGAKASEAIKQNRPLNTGATKKSNVMGFEAEIPKVASNPDIGKVFSDIKRYSTEPDFRIVETPDTATVLKGYTITKDATGTKVRPKIDIIETSDISPAELDAFKAINKGNERILTSKYEKSTVKDGITSAQTGAQEVKLYRPTQVKAKNVLQDINAETLDFKLSDDWRMEVQIPKTKGTGRPVDSIEQFESRKVTEQYAPEYAEDYVTHTTFEKTLHQKLSIDRMGESYEFVRGKIQPEAVPKTPKATKSNALSNDFSRSIDLMERFEGGERSAGKLKVQGKLQDPNAQIWEIPQLDSFKSMQLSTTEGAFIKRGSIGAKGKALKPGSKKPAFDIVPDDAFAKGSYKTKTMSGVNDLGTRMQDHVKIMGDMNSIAPDKISQFSFDMPKSTRNAISGKVLKKAGKTGKAGTEASKGTINAELKPSSKLKPGEINAKQILELNKGGKKRVDLLNKKAANAVRQVRNVTSAGVALGTIASTGIKSANRLSESLSYLPAQAQAMPQYVSPLHDQLPATLITPMLGITSGQIQWQGNRQKQTVTPIQKQITDTTPRIDLIQDQIPDTTKKPDEILPGGGFGFGKPGYRVAGVLPGKKKSAKKKVAKRKGTMKPGDLHNKYRNPLEIKFKL